MTDIDAIKKEYQNALVTALVRSLPTLDYFTTDDIRRLVGEPPVGVHPNNIGTAFRRVIPLLIENHAIEVVGTTHSSLPQGHRRRLPLYKSRLGV